MAKIINNCIVTSDFYIKTVTGKKYEDIQNVLNMRKILKENNLGSLLDLQLSQIENCNLSKAKFVLVQCFDIDGNIEYRWFEVPENKISKFKNITKNKLKVKKIYVGDRILGISLVIFLMIIIPIMLSALIIHNSANKNNFESCKSVYIQYQDDDEIQEKHYIISENDIEKLDNEHESLYGYTKIEKIYTDRIKAYEIRKY